MDLNQIIENRLFPVAIVIGVLMLVLVAGGPAIKNKITDDVIEKMRKEHSPGPYAPGFDPDKVNPSFWSQQVQPTQNYTVLPSQDFNYDSITETWNNQWEQARH